jgi:hypothetical protein
VWRRRREQWRRRRGYSSRHLHHHDNRYDGFHLEQDDAHANCSVASVKASPRGQIEAEPAQSGAGEGLGAARKPARPKPDQCDLRLSACLDTTSRSRGAVDCGLISDKTCLQLAILGSHKILSWANYYDGSLHSGFRRLVCGPPPVNPSRSVRGRILR